MITSSYEPPQSLLLIEDFEPDSNDIRDAIHERLPDLEIVQAFTSQGAQELWCPGYRLGREKATVNILGCVLLDNRLPLSAGKLPQNIGKNILSNMRYINNGVLPASVLFGISSDPAEQAYVQEFGGLAIGKDPEIIAVHVAAALK